ncbi:uncharacterized protein LOC122178940 [Lagopus leucura]|uniref:uncharacterized protein LOC122178940 n=1 Tax=Lagopus leucura TaxID=30410 RepID=UPI001C66E612|nr:uncharacterized protein LOC122178940 [Lagopus leucura]
MPRNCGISFFEISKTCLDVSLGTLLWMSLLEQALGQMDPEVLPHLGHAYPWKTHLPETGVGGAVAGHLILPWSFSIWRLRCAERKMERSLCTDKKTEKENDTNTDPRQVNNEQTELPLTKRISIKRRVQGRRRTGQSHYTWGQRIDMNSCCYQLQGNMGSCASYNQEKAFPWIASSWPVLSRQKEPYSLASPQENEENCM